MKAMGGYDFPGSCLHFDLAVSTAHYCRAATHASIYSAQTSTHRRARLIPRSAVTGWIPELIRLRRCIDDADTSFLYSL